MFEVQRDKHGIDQMRFHLPPATSFLRLHAPSATTTTSPSLVRSSSRRTAIAARGQGRGHGDVRSGAVRGRAGRVSTGEHVGSFEVGIGFASLLDNLKLSHGLELALFVEEELLESHRGRDVFDDDYNRVGKYVKYRATHWSLIQGAGGLRQPLARPDPNPLPPRGARGPVRRRPRADVPAAPGTPVRCDRRGEELRCLARRRGPIDGVAGVARGVRHRRVRRRDPDDRAGLPRATVEEIARRFAMFWPMASPASQSRKPTCCAPSCRHWSHNASACASRPRHAAPRNRKTGAARRDRSAVRTRAALALRLLAVAHAPCEGRLAQTEGAPGVAHRQPRGATRQGPAGHGAHGGVLRRHRANRREPGRVRRHGRRASAVGAPRLRYPVAQSPTGVRWICAARRPTLASPKSGRQRRDREPRGRAQRTAPRVANPSRRSRRADAAHAAIHHRLRLRQLPFDRQLLRVELVSMNESTTVVVLDYRQDVQLAGNW